MIVATAGHVDHGKTSLVRALTSVDTDRLPEEKKRGMTIDLGFAYLPLDGANGGETEAIGFVDVPGHERFVRNMICGLSTIDFGMLVIAADDGPMPQTREHLAILDLLAVRDGLVALTKIDRVGTDRIAALRREIEALLAPTCLARAPIFPVSTTTGTGLDALGAHVVARARSHARRPAGGNFRLAVDRAFRVPGTGLVVTGTAVSGAVAVGDTVRTASGQALRVRSLHVHNRAAPTGHAGERCALNLVGAGEQAASIGRGDWILAARAPNPVARFDAHLRLLADAPVLSTQRASVHVHLATAHSMGRVVVLGRRTMDPGSSALVQIVLERSLGAAYGDRFVVREATSGVPVGGGVVVDIDPPLRGRARASRLACLAGMVQADHRAALQSLLAGCPDGVDLDRFSNGRNLSDAECASLFACVPMVRVPTSRGEIGLSPTHWERITGEVIEALAQWHRDAPQSIGLAEDRAPRASRPHIDRAGAIGIAREMARRGLIVRSAGTVRLPMHRPAIDPLAEALWHRIEPLIDGQPLRPPSVHELALGLGESGPSVQAALEQSARLGRLMRISPKRYYRPDALRRLGQTFSALAESDPKGEVSVIAFRDRSGIGRNVSIEVLEFLDRIRFTRRRDNLRTVLRPLDEVLPEPDDAGQPRRSSGA